MNIRKSENNSGGWSASMAAYLDFAGVFPSAIKSYPTNSARAGRNLVFRKLTVMQWCWNVESKAIKKASKEYTVLAYSKTSSIIHEAPGSPLLASNSISNFSRHVCRADSNGVISSGCCRIEVLPWSKFDIMLLTSCSHCLGLRLYLENVSFFISVIICTNAGAAFLIPIGNRFHLFLPSGTKNAVLAFDNWSMSICQYPESKSIVIMNSLSSTSNIASSHLVMGKAKGRVTALSLR